MTSRRGPRRWFGDLRVSRKLSVVILVHLLHAAVLLVVTAYGMKALSASRAYVEGEGLWSKAQKEGTLELIAYAQDGDPEHYAEFLREIDVTLGDRQARLELDRKATDEAVVRDGFLRGRLHPDDITDVIWLYENFHKEPHLARAIAVWAQADGEIDVLLGIAERLHGAIQANDTAAVPGLVAEVYASDARLTVLEDDFSRDLGNGVRWLTGVVNAAAIGLTIVFVSLALLVSASAARQITRSLRTLKEAAQAVAGGDLSRRVGLDGRDEVAAVGRTFDAMTQRLQGMLEERRGLEEARANAAAQQREIARLGELDAFRMQFINNAAHELRTPLTPLGMQLHVLTTQRAKTYSPEEARGLEIITRNVQRLHDLVEDLLEVSRYQAGRMQIEPVAGDLHAVIRETLETYAEAAKGKDVTLHAELLADGAARFDPRRISQVLYNLVGNALKFTPAGGRILVSCATEEGHHVLRVTDNGVGIRAESLPKLFQPFSQVHEVPVAQRGSGLGLFISRALVELHGGTIAAASPGLGQGTTFTVRLPVNQAPAPAPAKT